MFHGLVQSADEKHAIWRCYEPDSEGEQPGYANEAVSESSSKPRQPPRPADGA